MSQPEIDARIDLLVGRKKGTTRYVSAGKKKGKARQR